MGLRTSRGRSRLVRQARGAVATLLVASSPVLLSAVHERAAQAQVTADPKALLASADKAARAKDWAKAASDFDAANKAQPSADALEGLANAHYQQKHDGEAYAAYDEWNKKYGASAPKPKKTVVDARVKELESRTGALSIEASEPGASITVDDHPMGTTPLGAPLRLAAGPHRVRVAKDGFAPVDQVPNVNAGSTTTLTAKLEASSSKGRISVKEKTGKPLRVLVDGVDMGDAPWSGEVEAGPHDVGGRAGTIVAVVEKVTVERGKTRDVELVASVTVGSIKVSTSDGKGLIYLDGKLVGEGTFTSDVPAGTHALRITREGYDPFEEQVVLKDKETLSRSVTLNLTSKIETNAVQAEKRELEGIYGGFGLMLTFLPGGMGHSMASTCDPANKPAELASCDGTSGAIGGGLNGFIGYHWDPVGVELFAGGQYDQSSPTLNWVASSNDPGFGPDPARTEKFHVRRFGGFAMFRIRLTHEWSKIRLSLAGGVGISLRSMLLTRDTTAAADSSLKDTYVPGGQGYASPIIGLEPTVQYRLSPSKAISLGLSLLVERPGVFSSGNPTTPEDRGHHLGNNGLTTPPYVLASGTQVYLGPTLGMMFGP